MDPGFQLTPAEKYTVLWDRHFGRLSVCCLVSYKSCSSRVLATVTSHRRSLPLCHGIWDNPSGRFPFCLFMSLSTWCLATLLGAFLPSCRRGSCSCCYYYYQYAQIWSMSMHHFSHSTPDHHFRHSCLELSSACSTVFAWLFASVNGAWNLSSSDVTWKQLTHCTQCSSGVFHTDLCNYLHITSTT